MGLLASGAAAQALPTTDIRLRVVFYPAIVPTAPSDGSKAALTADDVRTVILSPLSKTISSRYPLYEACPYVLSANTTPECDPTNAAILVTTQIYPDPKPIDPTKPQLLVTMRSFDMINGRALATVTPAQTIDLTSLNTSGAAAALKAVTLTSDQISLLLGTPAITGGRVTLFQGYEPYIQLVPTLAKSDDPSYLPLISNLLDRRGLPAVPSQFNAGAVVSGTTPLDAICGRGQRYLVYSVSSENYSHPVSFSTRIQTHASGQLFDCTNMTVIPVGLDQHISVPTTKSPLASLIAIVSAAFVSKSNSWAGTLQFGGLVSAFVDTDPDSIAVRDSVSDRALQGLVDNLCVALDNQPTPPPVPALEPLVVRVQTAATAKNLTPQQIAARSGARAAFAAVQKAQKTGTDAQLAAALVAFNRAIQVERAAGVRGNLLEAESLVDLPAGGSSNSSQASLAAGTTAPAQPAAAGTALVSIDVSNFVAPSPPPLKCHDPRLDIAPGAGANATDARWKLAH
jgi:hypothetical protein